MNKTQRDYLQNRLYRIAEAKCVCLPVSDPKHIAEARKLVSEYDSLKRKEQEEKRKRVLSHKVAIEDALYFSEETEVLSSLRAFEAAQF